MKSNKVFVMIASTEFIDRPHENYIKFIDPATEGYSSHVIGMTCFKSRPNFMDSIKLYSEFERDVVYFYCYEGLLDGEDEVFIDFEKFVTMFITDKDLMSF